MPASPEVGSTASSYEILAKLAEGGMAEIFLARGASAAGVERYVVLKRVIRERAHDTELVKMFLDEARLAAQLQHPNVAQVFDVGRLGESYFFTMEYVHGETVRAIQKHAADLRQPIPIGIVLAIAAGAAAGLHHAHERKGVGGKPLGIVHRDVSPTNLMVSFEGHVKVVDFGVAKAADRRHTTMDGTVKGKIAYMSPEQCESRGIDRRTDLFALGIVLWELLVGERLYERSTDFQMMTAICDEPAEPPSQRRAGVPPELDALVLRLLAKDPKDRFQTGRELVDTIEQIAERTALPLTASSLARFMRDWFGERPEPWIDGEISHHPSIVTLRSDKIPQDLAAVDAPADEDALAAVPTLATGELPGGEWKPTLIESPRKTLAGPAAPTPVTNLKSRDKPIAPTMRGVGTGSGPVAAIARGAAPAPTPAPRRDSRVPLAIAAGVLAIVAVVLAAWRPWQASNGAPPPAGVNGPPPPPLPAADAMRAPPPPPADASAPLPPPVDAAAPAPPADAPPPRDAGIRRPPPRDATIPLHSRRDAADDCANDPMACQR